MVGSCSAVMSATAVLIFLRCPWWKFKQGLENRAMTVGVKEIAELESRDLDCYGSYKGYKSRRREEDFGPFGLEQDFSHGRDGVGAGQGRMPVDIDAEFVVVAEHFQFVPLTMRFFNFMRAARAFFVAPWVATGAVEACGAVAFADAIHGEGTRR